MSNILEIKDLSFSYGEIKALHGINLEVGEKEVVAMLGGNGAGKTTTLKAISATIRGITNGDIYYMGEKITNKKSWDIAKMGIAHCIEGRHIFSQLTVRENLEMGAYLRRKENYQNELEYVFNLFPRLKDRETQLGGTLSGGEQQMLAVGRALMQKPKLLLMDEPSLGLAPLIIEEIFRTIRKINQDGVPILLVEQNTNAALQVAHRGYVIETGYILKTDTADNLLHDEDIKKSYLGG